MTSLVTSAVTPAAQRSAWRAGPGQSAKKVREETYPVFILKNVKVMYKMRISLYLCLVLRAVKSNYFDN